MDKSEGWKCDYCGCKEKAYEKRVYPDIGYVIIVKCKKCGRRIDII